MKLETIKRNNKKKIIIGSMVVLSVVACLTLTTSRAKYRSVQNLKLASGTVKINQYDFKIMAMYQSEDGENYTDINVLPFGNYVVNEGKSKCLLSNGDIDRNVIIEYKNNKINFLGLTTKNTKCYVYLDKKETKTIQFANATVVSKLIAPDFTKVATGAETEENNGVFEVDDPMYGIGLKGYYWRGAATTNHVIFANKCWRIIRINGDGTIRLIYNGTIQSGNTCLGNGATTNNVILKGTSFNSHYDNTYVGWTYEAGKQRPSNSVPQTSGTASIMKTAIESWFNGSDFTSAQRLKVAEGKFCNDRRIANEETWVQDGSTTQYYAAYERIFGTTKEPSLDCASGDIYSLKVGLITADEVQFAGASGGTWNQQYYLYNQQNYWTMTPDYWDGDEEFPYVFFVWSTGQLSDMYRMYGDQYVRPVINLRSDVTFNSGSDGTQNNPYIVQ